MNDHENLHTLAYVSSARGVMTEAGLQHLLRNARANNEREGVTGLLLHADGNFMQYIEGPPDALQRVYAIIQADRKHTGLMEIFSAEASTRSFSGWTMAYLPAHKTEILRLSSANWATQDSAGSRPARSRGLSLLMDFWDLHERRIG